MKTTEETLESLIDDVKTDILARARQEGYDVGLSIARAIRLAKSHHAPDHVIALIDGCSFDQIPNLDDAVNLAIKTGD